MENKSNRSEKIISLSRISIPNTGRLFYILLLGVFVIVETVAASNDDSKTIGSYQLVTSVDENTGSHLFVRDLAEQYSSMFNEKLEISTTDKPNDLDAQIELLVNSNNPDGTLAFFSLSQIVEIVLSEKFDLEAFSPITVIDYIPYTLFVDKKHSGKPVESVLENFKNKELNISAYRTNTPGYFALLSLLDSVGIKVQDGRHKLVKYSGAKNQLKALELGKTDLSLGFISTYLTFESPKSTPLLTFSKKSYQLNLNNSSDVSVNAEHWHQFRVLVAYKKMSFEKIKELQKKFGLLLETDYIVEYYEDNNFLFYPSNIEKFILDLNKIQNDIITITSQNKFGYLDRKIESIQIKINSLR